jgi:hypothetical protein
MSLLDAVCVMALVTSSLVSRTASSAAGHPPRTCPTNERARRTWSAEPGKTRRRGRITVALVMTHAPSRRTPGTATWPAGAKRIRQRPRRLPPSAAGTGTSIPGRRNDRTNPPLQLAREFRRPPGRDHVRLAESLRKPCFDAGQETRRIASRIFRLTYRHVSSCLVIFRFPLR